MPPLPFAPLAAAPCRGKKRVAARFQRRVSQLKRSNFRAIVHSNALMNWHKLLFLFLWISPHMLLGVLVVVLCKRRLYREFPCFLAFVFYEIAEFILLFTLYLFA